MTMKSVSAHNPRAPDIQCLYCAPALPKMPERGDELESPETFCHPRGCISSVSSFRDPCLACRTVETDRGSDRGEGCLRGRLAHVH